MQQTTSTLLQEFLKEDEYDTMKYIDDTESLITNTKILLKGIVNGDLSFEALKEKLLEIDTDLTYQNETLEEDLDQLQKQQDKLEQQYLLLKKEEEKQSDIYLKRIEKVKNDIEEKDFTIQQMEFLYHKLENIIQKNISKKIDPPFCLADVEQFFKENDSIKKEYKTLQEKREKLIKEYNQLLRENLDYRVLDEKMDVNKIKDVLEEVSAIDQLEKSGEKKVAELESRYSELILECNKLTIQIKNIINSLEGLNIDHPRLDRELGIINKQFNPVEDRLNRTYTAMYENKEWADIDKEPPEKPKIASVKTSKAKRRMHKKTAII